MIDFYYSPGACSLAVHIALEEIHADYQIHCFSIGANENCSIEYLKLNKWGRVPTIEVDGVSVSEVSAILSYLVRIDTGRRLAPSVDSLDSARAMEWCSWLASSHHTAYAQLWRPERFIPEDASCDRERVRNHALERIRQFNQHIDQTIRAPYVLGKYYSIADPYLIVFYRWGWRIGINMKEDYPRWADWSEHMLERSAVTRALEQEGIAVDG